MPETIESSPAPSVPRRSTAPVPAPAPPPSADRFVVGRQVYTHPGLSNEIVRCERLFSKHAGDDLRKALDLDAGDQLPSDAVAAALLKAKPEGDPHPTRAAARTALLGDDLKPPAEKE